MNPASPFHGLAGRFVSTVCRFPERPALDVDGQVLTYAELGRRAGHLAQTLREHHSEAAGPIAIFARRSLTAYVGILASWIAGRAYVPLNPKFPAERTRQMLAASGSSLLLVGRECLGILEDVLAGFAPPLTILFPDGCDIGSLADRWTGHRFVPAGLPSADPSALRVPELDPQAAALLLFTSGSTGSPKGVPPSHFNVDQYIWNIGTILDLSPEDRVSQAFDLTFDLSLHDMFTCWTSGACLVSIPDQAVMAPARIIQEKRLTVWFSVPSVISFMRRLGLLKPGAFPSLRRSLFCGEPLPASSTEAWLQAACNSTVANLYGPTETTVAVTHYAWKANRDAEQCVNGIVPIGRPLPGQQARVFDASGHAVPDGQSGELCLSGSQVVGSYWRDAELSRSRFVKLPQTGTALWYRTGDLALRDQDGCLHFLGRLDEQIKVRGYRVELQEIDSVLRRVSQDEQAVAIAWPLKDGHAEGIVAFLRAPGLLQECEILSRMRQTLPEYMVPRKIFSISELPLNANGKIDRKKLAAILEEAS